MSALILLLAACGTPPSLDGKVVDIWGNPVEGATVMMVGQGEKPLTDAEGRYSLTLVPGVHEIKAGRKGYVQEHATIEIVEGEVQPGPVFQLYPRPEEPGFYAVASGRYVALGPVMVHSVGNELRSYRGLKSKGDAALSAEEFREFIFHTELTEDEILRLGVQLRRLEYLADGSVPGPLRDTPVKVGLYTDAGEVPVDMVPMRSRTDYRIVPREPLEHGVYAFQTQQLLDPEHQDSFDALPDELRVVFPVDLR
jgi:hypothetical protein